MTQKEIRMVVADLDGTLLDPNRKISEEAVETIDRLRKRGVLFTFVTGRPPYAVEQFAKRVGLTAPVVCCNGAVIVLQRTLLFQHSMKVDPLQGLLECTAKLGITVLLYSGGVVYTLAPTEWTRMHEALGRIFPIWNLSEHPDASAEKITLISDGAKIHFAALVPELLELKKTYSTDLYGDLGCEIAAPEVDKGTGLSELCRLCEVAPSQVLAIGDNEEDHPMFRFAGVGAAVANAAAATKEYADYRCAAPYSLGVAEAIRKFVEGDA